ncbi:MAG: hypothetical protein ABII75_02090 [Candidatus Omnitrophota bacterium]
MDAKIIQQSYKTTERDDILNLLLKRVTAFRKQYRQNIAILGYEGLGKTTIIFNLLNRIKNFEILPIYIEVKSGSITHFAQNFVGVLLYQFLSKSGEAMEEGLEVLLNNCRDKIPKTAKVIASILKLIKEKAPDKEIYSSVFDLPQVFFDETKKPVLLILDEFHNLDSFVFEAPFIELSNKIMLQKNTMYILASSATFTAEDILSRKLSLLFGNFETLKLQPFDNATAKGFIEERLPNFNIPEILKNFLIFFTGGYPFYLQVITNQIKNSCIDTQSKDLNEKILLASISQTLHNDHGILNLYFNNKHGEIHKNNGSELLNSILLSISNGQKKASRICAILNKKPQEVNRHLNKLVQKDTISRKGAFLYINDTLFSHWLKFVFEKKRGSFNIDYKHAENMFLEQIRKLLNSFIQESGKSVGLRLKELFEMFENDIIELDKKKFMLTHFDQIDIKDVNSTTVLNAKRLKKWWVCCVENSFVDEAQINYFLAASKGQKCIKKILIALDGIDVNARLKALDARAWIWNQDTLNELLAIFEKPRIIK